LLCLNLPQTVRRNLFLQGRTAMVQQLLKVPLRRLDFVLCERLIPQTIFFSDACGSLLTLRAFPYT
jgi:hypothetical protein